MNEIFIHGDPRFLSGGAPTCISANYERPPETVESLGRPHTVVTSDAISPSPDLASTVALMGQRVHSGRSRYHERPEMNVFLHKDEWPSAGVELETILRKCNDAFRASALDDLKSNWFHFERDGSLDRDHGGTYGLELITEPLPPRAYRRSELWTGLQNILTPWLRSFDSQETGLHVHVGLNQFEDINSIPLEHHGTRRTIGKLLSGIVYFSVVDQAFIDRVTLRGPGSYCCPPSDPVYSKILGRVTAGKATGASLLDAAVELVLKSMGHDTWRSGWRSISTHITAGWDFNAHPDWGSCVTCTTGHDTEVNMEHRYTIEFRRAKGTLHALSVHRIVELMTSIVRYAGKIAREPDMEVSRKAFMEWLASTTTSEALKTLAVEHMKGM